MPAWRRSAVSGLTPTSLTGRLVATLVLLVVTTSIVLTVLSSLTVHRLLYSNLDRQAEQALDRTVSKARHGVPILPPAKSAQQGPSDTDGDDRGFGVGDAAGTLVAGFADTGYQRGSVVTSSDKPRDISTAALDQLARLPHDKDVHSVTLPGVGPFHVKTYVFPDGGRIVSGMSTRSVDDTVAKLLLYEVVLALGAVGLAGVTGRWIVRRQLRPLRDVAATAHEVADLPLSRGEIGTTVRVPEELTDERTEVGSVGAALNTLLEHVEHALDERHRSEQQVRQFVADASHELRTPLTTIHGYAELSRRTRPVDPAQLQLAMGKVEAEATRMSSLVEDLLLLARLDAGRPLARDEVDLTRLALETVADARVVGPQHRWVLELPDEPVEVPGDEQRLHQVVTNLLGNARRHTPPGTTVTVSVAVSTDAGADAGAESGAESGQPTAVLVVADDGPGMSPELVRSAFERFTRGDSSRTRESGGAGLGLSLVEAITVAHGGTVSVTSEPGRTAFEVRLPAGERARPTSQVSDRETTRVTQTG